MLNTLSRKWHACGNNKTFSKKFKTAEKLVNRFNPNIIS